MQQVTFTAASGVETSDYITTPWFSEAFDFSTYGVATVQAMVDGATAGGTISLQVTSVSDAVEEAAVGGVGIKTIPATDEDAWYNLDFGASGGVSLNWNSNTTIVQPAKWLRVKFVASEGSFGPLTVVLTFREA